MDEKPVQNSDLLGSDDECINASYSKHIHAMRTEDS